MKNPRGRVITVADLESSPHAIVEVDAAVHCARCAEGKGCGAGLLGGGRGIRRVDARIGAGVTVREGDEVRIELKPSRILYASLLVYGLPLCGALAGAGIGFLAGLGELDAAGAAIVGIVAGLLVARMRLRRDDCLRQFRPTIVERLPVSH